MSETEKLVGSIERVTYHNPETGYFVIKVRVKGQSDAVTLVGIHAHVNEGEVIEVSGNWQRHATYGVQFKCESVFIQIPNSIAGIRKYLASGLVHGIGPHFAAKLVDKFGDRVFEVIEKEPQRLIEVEGLGKSRSASLIEAWKTQRAIQDIMVFLHAHGVSTSRAMRIYRMYGDRAMEKVTENPYRLARDIPGIGFRTADEIASHLGISKDSLIRAQAGLLHTLYEKTAEGHCAFPEEMLVAETADLLDVAVERVKEALQYELSSQAMIPEEIRGVRCVYPRSLYYCEVGVSHRVKELLMKPVVWGDYPVEEGFQWLKKNLKIELAPLQRKAVGAALGSKVLVITGGPGTGKTTLIQAILLLLKRRSARILLCSPTGRAAKRLSECTGMTAMTIHRLLGFDSKKGKFVHNRETPLTADCLILDEASMVDSTLMYHLLQALPDSSSLIIVGDVDQLPSVGPGSVLKDFIDSKKIPTVRLTEVFRQASESHIILNAHRINSGLIPKVPAATSSSSKETSSLSDFYFISVPEEKIPKDLVRETPEYEAVKKEARDRQNSKILNLILEVVTHRIPKRFHLDPIQQVQVLCPMYRGTIGADNLNSVLQKSLNPSPSCKIERFGTTFAVSDKVMVSFNDYDKEVFNGDIGRISEIDIEAQKLYVTFDALRIVEFGFSELDILKLAYAVSVHKSQGSEYPAVVLPITMGHYLMLKRNLVYTGVTRGKKLVVLIGSPKALAMAVRAKDQSERWTALSFRLSNLLTEIPGDPP